jgi:hypothetical protein
MLGPLGQERPKRITLHLTRHPRQPFISLAVEVTVVPLSGVSLLAARLMVVFRTVRVCFLRLEILFIVAGGLAGSLLGGLFSEGIGLVLSFAGLTLGYLAGPIYRRYRADRGA